MTAVKKTVTINNKYGIHARPAAQIVSLCKSFVSDVSLYKIGEPPANAKNILDIMMLGAANGAVLEIVANGSDATVAVDKLSSLIENGFGHED